MKTYTSTDKQLDSITFGSRIDVAHAIDPPRSVVAASSASKPRRIAAIPQHLMNLGRDASYERAIHAYPDDP